MRAPTPEQVLRFIGNFFTTSVGAVAINVWGWNAGLGVIGTLLFVRIIAYFEGHENGYESAKKRWDLR